VPGMGTTICDRCLGDGHVRVRDADAIDCPVCGGTGRIAKRPVTIEELEAILNSEDDHDVTINPDGTITTALRPKADVLPFVRSQRDAGQY
jgi:DnaJ-class molecular chaperone